MRSAPNIRAEQYRVAGDREMGNNGQFLLPLRGAALFCQVSDGGGWDHVSVSVDANPRRCPTWEEMCIVCRLFFRSDEWAMQLHPPPDQNINLAEHCLHLWRPQSASERQRIALEWQRHGAGDSMLGTEAAWPIPLPPAWMVGAAPPE
jgi:hypothetical protein